MQIAGPGQLASCAHGSRANDSNHQGDDTLLGCESSVRHDTIDDRLLHVVLCVKKELVAELHLYRYRKSWCSDTPFSHCPIDFQSVKGNTPFCPYHYGVVGCWHSGLHIVTKTATKIALSIELDVCELFVTNEVVTRDLFTIIINIPMPDKVVEYISKLAKKDEMMCGVEEPLNIKQCSLDDEDDKEIIQPMLYSLK